MNGRWTELTVIDDTIIGDIDQRSRHLFVGVLMSWRAHACRKNTLVTLPFHVDVQRKQLALTDDSTRQKLRSKN
ncbi:unnamed protein product [Ectocarpus sp. 8 AP-2014]